MVAVWRRHVLAGKPDWIRLGLRIKIETATSTESKNGCGRPFHLTREEAMADFKARRLR
jgi:hypothetical protein